MSRVLLPLHRTLPLLAALGLAALLDAPPARADMVARHCDGPERGPVAAIVKGNACAGYRVARTSQPPRTVRFDFAGSGKLIASADGRTVVMIQSYLYGGIDATGDIVELVGAAEHKNPIAVHVYRDGKRIAQHRIHDLINRQVPIRKSVSHVHWLGSAPTVLGDKAFSIMTSRGTLTFSSVTGRLVKVESLPAAPR
jgi:hypothetical protein